MQRMPYCANPSGRAVHSVRAYHYFRCWKSVKYVDVLVYGLVGKVGTPFHTNIPLLLTGLRLRRQTYYLGQGGQGQQGT